MALTVWLRPVNHIGHACWAIQNSQRNLLDSKIYLQHKELKESQHQVCLLGTPVKFTSNKSVVVMGVSLRAGPLSPWPSKVEVFLLHWRSSPFLKSYSSKLSLTFQNCPNLDPPTPKSSSGSGPVSRIEGGMETNDPTLLHIPFIVRPLFIQEHVLLARIWQDH